MNLGFKINLKVIFFKKTYQCFEDEVIILEIAIIYFPVISREKKSINSDIFESNNKNLKNGVFDE